MTVSGHHPFKKAQPIWVEFEEGLGQEDQGWLRVAQFQLSFPQCQSALLRIAGWTSIRAWLNGEFVLYGPARTALGHFRFEEIDISPFVAEKGNELTIEVVSYGIPTFSNIFQPPFVQAEVETEHGVVAFTGLESRSLMAKEDKSRRRHVQRYSYMRGWSEAYVLDGRSKEWKTSDLHSGGHLKIISAIGGELLPRRTPSSAFHRIKPVSGQTAGKFQVGKLPNKPRSDRTLDNIGKDVVSWQKSQFTVFPFENWQRLSFHPAEIAPSGEKHLTEGSTLGFEFERDITALVQFELDTQESGTLYLAADEIKDGPVVDPLRNACLDIIQFDFQPGHYQITTAEPIAFRYLDFVALQGSVQISNVQAIEIAHPDVKQSSFTETGDWQVLFDAAYETLRPNSFDFFTDCPGRERAGYACDSFFTSRAAYELFGNTLVEEAFLENYAMAPSFPAMPQGMIPMCYPSDILGGTYIPQWPLWLLVQVGEFQTRNPSSPVTAALREKFENLLAWFKPYVNEYGLLENLPGWNFIEWSGANDLVGGVHFPTNMLYARALEVYSNLYESESNAMAGGKDSPSQKLWKTIHEMSYDGQFYRDHALRVDGKLVPQPQCSEVCQSYVFFFELATPQSQPQLWKNYVSGDKVGKGLIAPNLFIGDVLRLDLLTRWNEKTVAKQVLEQIFLPMAKKTGTLWEMEQDWASCCHGFASYVAVIINRIFEP